MMVSLIVPGLLFILSIVLLSGKGSWLIAGYNTSRKEQQEKYDKKKLSRSAGVMLLIVTVATLSLTLLHINFIIYAIIIFISVIITIIFMNKYCQKPISEDEKPNTNFEKGPWQNNNTKMLTGIGIVVIVGIITAISMFYSSKPPVYSVNDGTFIISTEFGQKINLSDIKSVQVKNDLPANLSKVNGLGLGTILKGKFTSNIGDVTVYIDSSIPPYIYINTTSGLIILNNQSKTKTQTLFSELNSNIKR